MRSRYIKPGFWENETIGRTSHTDRLLLIGLWCLADRDGKLEDRPDRIKHLLFGYDRRAVDVEKSLCNLMSLHLITRYDVTGGGAGRYILIPNFKKHQFPHPHEKPSKIPDPQLSNDMKGNVITSKVNSSVVLSTVVLSTDNQTPDKTGQKTGLVVPEDLRDHIPEIERWMAYKKERGQAYKPKALEAFFNRFRSIPKENRAASVDHSMANNWAGLFEKRPDRREEESSKEPSWEVANLKRA